MDATDNPHPCSWLFRVPPFGLGTSQIESLTGYIARVARNHLITPYTLLHRGLKWWEINEPERVGEWTRYISRLELRPAINAHASGHRWVELLETLGGVTGLAGCTAASWSHLFPDRGLLKKHHAWCPQCFAEDGDERYDRLLWNFAPTKACTRHRCRLVQRCPTCASEIPAIHARSVPGVCPRCETSLVSEDSQSLPADEFDLGISQVAADFLEAVSAQPGLVQQTSWNNGEILDRCMGAAGISDAGELARLLNISRITTWYWLRNRAAPDFTHTLQICYAFNLPLADLLIGRIPDIIVPRGNGELALRPARRTRREFNEVIVAQRIETFRAQCSDNPPSLADVGRETGFAVRLLRIRFPATCRDISAAHRARCRELLAARREVQRQVFRAAIAECRASRVNPTRGDVLACLPKRGILRSPAARRDLDQLLLSIQ